MRAAKLLFVYILCFAFFSATAHPVDSLKYLKDKLKIYATENPTTNLYLHLDKNTYAQNDNIWFKAYLLASGNLTAKTVENKVLYVRLVDRDKKMIVKGQFPMYDIRANGNLQIPETVKDGDYTLYAFTDRMINFKEEDAFVQHITIKREEFRPLEAEASVVDTTKLVRGAKVQITVRVKDGGILAEGVKGNYELLDGATVLKSGITTTNLFGEGFIDFVYPQLADDKILKVKIVFKRKNDFAEVLLNLKHEGNTINVAVHPEGGSLIVGVPAKMVINATDVNGSAVSTLMDMREGTKTIAHFTTDKYGAGIVTFIPKANVGYSFSYEISGTRKSVAMSYAVKDHGYMVAVTKVKGAPVAVIKNIGEKPDALVIVRAMDQVMGTKRVNIPAGDSLSVPLPEDQLPKEVLSVAVFDTVGTVLSERLYSNSKPNNYRVNISADAKSYATRQKVTLAVNINDSNGAPVASNFSVAVVEKNSIDYSKYLTINHSWDYKAINGNIGSFITAKTPADIDNALISRGWNNSWHRVQNYIPNGGTPLIENTGGVTGTVYLNPNLDPKLTPKEVAKLLDTTTLLLKSTMGFTPVKIRPDHTFSIPPSTLLTTENEEIVFVKPISFRTKFHLTIDIPDRIFDVKVQDGPLLFSPVRFNTLALSKPPEKAATIKKITALREVKIRAGGDPKGENFQTGECYDYVCVNGGLYCKNHQPGMPGSELNVKPVPGQTYLYSGGTKVVYYGCDDFRFKTVTAPKSFNAPDYGTNQFAEPVFGTTIYWEPNAGTPATGSNNISFYTSDLPGDYTVIVQGIDTKTLKPIYGTASFTVK